MNLVQKAISLIREERRRGRVYDQNWVVFDKDDFLDEDFNGAIEFAESNGLHVAYSNQAFELWFLLHFNLIQGCMHRSLYAEKLSNLLGFTYSKEAGLAAEVYNALFDRMPQAIRNAKTIIDQMTGIPPARAESSTTVYRLVEELKNYTE